MRISDWSSDVCSSDLREEREVAEQHPPTLSACHCAAEPSHRLDDAAARSVGSAAPRPTLSRGARADVQPAARHPVAGPRHGRGLRAARSEEHTSELQSLMRISYAVFCLKKKNKKNK